MLKKEFQKITNEEIIKNYHPDFFGEPGNIFYILGTEERYRVGHGKYFIIEDAGEYICSAGWNKYDLDSNIALLLTRTYVNKRYRAQYNVGNYILPKAILETESYPYCWITSNKHNKAIDAWFSRVENKKQPTLFNNWPEIYKRFKPIGKRDIYYTVQDVYELVR